MLQALGLISAALFFGAGAASLARAPGDRRLAGRLRVLLTLSVLPWVGGALYAASHPADLAELLGLRTPDGLANEVSRIALVRAGLLGSAMTGILLALLAPAALLRLRNHLDPDIRTLASAVTADLRALLGESQVRWTLIVVLAAALIARLALVGDPMSFDEAITYVWFASRSPLDIVTDYSIPNNHILHSLGVYATAQLFGPTEWAVRLPALAAGLLVIPASALLARKVFDRDTAMLVAALVSAAPPMIEYSVQARGYTLAALLVVAAATFLHYGVQTRTTLAWALFALSLALALYASLPALMCGYLLAGWILLGKDRQPWVAQFIAASIGAGLLTVLLYGPAALRVGWLSVVAPGVARALPLDLRVANWREGLVGVAGCWTGALPGPLALILAGLLVTGSVVLVSGRRPGGRLAIALAGMLAAVFFVHRSGLAPRTLLPAFPVVMLLPAAGLATVLSRYARRLPAIVPVTAVSIAVLWPIARSTTPAPFTTPSGTAVSANRCAEGFIAEAPAAAQWAASQGTPAAPVLVHAYSGLLETIRFYLVGLGASPAVVVPVTPGTRLGSLDWYDSAFVLLNVDPVGGGALARAARGLGIDASALGASYEAVDVATGMQDLAVVKLRPLATRAPRDTTAPRIDPFEYPGIGWVAGRPPH